MDRMKVARSLAAVECVTLAAIECADTAAKMLHSLHRFEAALECVALDRLECDPIFPSDDVRHFSEINPPA